MKIITMLILLLPNLIYAQSIDYKAYKGKKVNSIASFQFSEAFYYDYIMNSSNLEDSSYVFINQSNSPEGILTKKYSKLLEENKDSTVNSIMVYSKLTLLFNLSYFSIIKYRLKLKGINQKMETILIEKINDKWQPSAKTSKIIEGAKLIIQLKSDAFSQFEYEEDNMNYPEINRFKKLCRDPDGTLNIIKLARIIEDNKTIFLKYID
jgi:hypothetical protein